MSLQMIIVLETVFAICAIIGFGVDTVPRWELWLCCWLFLSMDNWRCYEVGVVSTGPDYRWYGFTFDRDDSPMGFYCAMIFQGLLTLIAFFVFICQF